MKPLPTLLTCAAVLSIGAGITWIMMVTGETEPEPVQKSTVPLVRSMVVVAVDKRIDVTTQGTVTARTEIDLVTQVGGAVQWISASMANGGFFAAQEVLVRLDTRDQELEITRSLAQVAQAKLRVASEEAEAEIARREWEKLGKGEASALTLREPQVREAKAALAAAEAVLAKAKLDLERASISAPFAGRVRTKGVDVGQYVTVGTPLARVYSVDTAEVRLPLHDSKLRYLDLPLSYRDGPDNGPTPTVTLRAQFAQRPQQWAGRIVRTEGEVDARTRMVYAIAEIEDPYGRSNAGENVDRPPLSVGMFVDATIHGRTFRNVIEIPRSAVRSEDSVLVIDSDSRLQRREILLLDQNASTATVESGLEPGERICLSPISVFVEGMRVDLASPGGF